MAKRRTARQRSNQNAQKNSRQNGSAKARNYADSIDTGTAAKSSEIKENDLKAADVLSKTAETLVLRPPKGLVNLGNTCFFNSVMQNLCRTPGLLYALENANKEKELVVHGDDVQSLYCELGLMDKLSQALLNFLAIMNEDILPLNSGSNNQRQNKRSKTESPRVLFNQICNASPRFRGYRQQDSQELFQALLDGIKTEEIKRRKRAILSSLDILGKKAIDVDSTLRDRVKSYGQAVVKMPTVIDKIFAGKIVSSVLCDECGQITQVLEDFLDIPLPIVEGVQAHHVGDSKKYKKEAESDCSIDKTLVEDTTPSKHLMKKKKQQGRKNNRRQRTKSQTNANDVKNGIESLTTELESVNVEPLKGTDFSTKKTTKMNESDATAQKDLEIIEKSCQIVELAIKEALNETIHENGVGTSQEPHILNINGWCKGGFNVSKTVDSNTHLVESHDDIINEMNKAHSECQSDDLNLVGCKMNGVSNNSSTSNLNGLESSASDAHNSNNSNNLDEKKLANNEKQIKCGDSEPSSGNDEKEESPVDTIKTTQDDASLFDTPAKKNEVTKFTNFCVKLPTSLYPRYEPKNQECSIQSCLHKFTMAEMLTGQNKYGCEECTNRQAKSQEKPKTVYCNASKQLLIKVPPLILTLQLKRFQQTGRNLRKLRKQVDIPAELDISLFCTSDENSKHLDCDGQIRYRIYGIVEHSGSLSHGHYTAYVNVRPECTDILKHLGKDVCTPNATEDSQSYSQWYHVSDTAVSKSTQDRALNSNAYLVFYERML